MDTVAALPPDERQDLMRETAASMAVTVDLIEKDFWVCWALSHLFAAQLQPNLMFKGGTSLSKVFGLIERFSEDIDLVLDRAGLGFDGERDPARAPTGNRAQALLEELSQSCGDFVGGDLQPRLAERFASVLGPADDGWALSQDPADPQTLLFAYPRPASVAPTYIRPEVKIELGARGDQWPTTSRDITPYAADLFPTLFVKPVCTVSALAAERTFWEKATLLHREYHRAAPRAATLSRHYYDLAMLARSDVRERALRDCDLREAVVSHKKLFFRSAWASYQTAAPGTFHVVPHADLRHAVEQDYADMTEMFFGSRPAFVEIMEDLDELEREINALES